MGVNTGPRGGNRQKIKLLFHKNIHKANLHKISEPTKKFKSLAYLELILCCFKVTEI